MGGYGPPPQPPVPGLHAALLIFARCILTYIAALRGGEGLRRCGAGGREGTRGAETAWHRAAVPRRAGPSSSLGPQPWGRDQLGQAAVPLSTAPADPASPCPGGAPSGHLHRQVHPVGQLHRSLPCHQVCVQSACPTPTGLLSPHPALILPLILSGESTRNRAGQHCGCREEVGGGTRPSVRDAHGRSLAAGSLVQDHSPGHGLGLDTQVLPGYSLHVSLPCKQQRPQGIPQTPWIFMQPTL